MNRVVVAAVLVAACGSSQSSEVTPPATEVGEAAADAGPKAPTLDELRMAAIAKAVNETTAARHDCWAVGAADDYLLSGKVVVEVGFTDEGEVSRVVIVEDETRDRPLTRCLTAVYEGYAWPPVFDAHHSVRVPFEFAAPRAQYSVRSSHVETQQLGGGKLSAQLLLNQRNTGNPAISMTLLVARDGLIVAPHLHGSTEVLYVISGQARAGDARGMRQARAVGAGDFIYLAPGAGHALEQVGSADLRLLSIYAPAGAERRFAGGTDPDTQPVAIARRIPRKAPVPRIATAAGLSPLTIAAGKGRVSIAFDAASAKHPALYAGVLVFDAGAAVAGHDHAGETEALFLLDGGGTLTVAGVAFEVVAGDAIQLPPGVEHSLVVGEDGLRAIHFYTPSGPEQRFKGN